VCQGCGARSACPSCDFLMVCTRVCVDLRYDVNNCGACGRSCGGIGAWCDAGRCFPDCGFRTRCPGTVEGCVDTTSDRAHCGACGHACADGQRCVAGACV
jgi:hypothetical protein